MFYMHQAGISADGGAANLSHLIFSDLFGRRRRRPPAPESLKINLCFFHHLLLRIHGSTQGYFATMYSAIALNYDTVQSSQPHTD